MQPRRNDLDNKATFFSVSLRSQQIAGKALVCICLFIWSFLPNNISAQCDTLPTALRWDFAGYDSTYLDFSRSILDGSVARFVGADDFSPRGSECSAVVANADGSSVIYFNGVGLFDGLTLQPLANNTWLGEYPGRPLFSSNSSYFQPLILPHPGNQDQFYLFYGMSFRSDAAGQVFDLDMPAWVALYDMSLDSLIFRDSVALVEQQNLGPLCDTLTEKAGGWPLDNIHPLEFWFINYQLMA